LRGGAAHSPRLEKARCLQSMIFSEEEAAAANLLSSMAATEEKI